MFFSDALQIPQPSAVVAERGKQHATRDHSDTKRGNKEEKHTYLSIYVFYFALSMHTTDCADISVEYSPSGRNHLLEINNIQG